MKKIKEWKSEIEGKIYEFSLEKVKRSQVLTVNGIPIKIKPGFMSMILGFDEKFILDDKEARLVIERNKPDVVIDGFFLESGKKYIEPPIWVMAFVIICNLIVVVNLGGLLPAILGLSGGSLCLKVSRKSFPIVFRVLLCTVITVLAWSLWFWVIKILLNSKVYNL